MKKTLQIISSTHAREVNTKEKPPHPMTTNSWDKKAAGRYYKLSNEYNEAESSLKEYRIEAVIMTDTISGFPNFTKSKSTRYPTKMCGDYLSKKIGSVCKCETNEETLTCIVL